MSIAIVDTGICGDLREFPQAKRSPFSWAYDGNPWKDDLGHGSMTAAIAAATSAFGGKYDGVAPDATIIACKTQFDETELVQIYEHLITLVRSKQIGRLVINNSYGAYQCMGTGMKPDDPFPDVIQRAVDEGIVVVFAAGNNHVVVCNQDPNACADNTIWGANSLDYVMSVGTVNEDNRMSDPPLTAGGYSHRDSSRGPGELAKDFLKPDCVAPTYGEVVWNCGYRKMEWWGTSGAAPQVAGLAALILGSDPSLPPAQVYDRIRKTARNIGLGPACAGRGLIDCDAAV